MSNAAPSSTRQSGEGSAPRAGTTSHEELAAALKFLGDLANEVSAGTVDLPSFPDVVIRVCKDLADPDAKLTQIVKIVGTEPRLAARLIETANSAAFNLAGKPLTDLPSAITRLGHRHAQSCAMAFAVRQLRLAPALHSIAQPLSVLWEESIAVASICQVVARRTKISPHEAFLTGLLHGIGRLYIMVRGIGKPEKLWRDASFVDMVDGWHPGIGKAVLESWGFVEEMAQALSDQRDYDRASKSEADLTDVLIVSIALAGMLRERGPRTAAMNGLGSFRRLDLHAQDCEAILRHTEHELDSLHAALGC